MLSESDREEFKKLAASYMNALSALNHKDDEIYRFAETCGAFEDWRVLAKFILPPPDLCRARSHLIRKYYELRDEPPLGLGEWPPLERKTQIRINTLASAYERLLKEKRRLHDEILGLAEERGVLEDEDGLGEICGCCSPNVSEFCIKSKRTRITPFRTQRERSRVRRNRLLLHIPSNPCKP